MNTHKIIATVLLITLLLPLGAVSAQGTELHPPFREQFSTFVPQVCFATIPYAVDDRVFDWTDEAGEFHEGKSTEFHRTMNCLFNDALREAVEGVTKEVKKAADAGEMRKKTLRKLNLIDGNLSPRTDDCADILLPDIQRRQQRLKKKALAGAPEKFLQICDTGDGARPVYSSCWVSETVLNEWCGYQQFLLAKMRDYQSFVRENSDADTKRGRTQRWNTQQQRYQAEWEHTSAAITTMLEFYHHFQPQYRQHAWLVALQVELEHIRSQIQKAVDKINIWPAKFLYPMTYPG